LTIGQAIFITDRFLVNLSTCQNPAGGRLKSRTMPGAKRAFKFPLTEIPVKCPHCKAALVLLTVMDMITLGRRACPKCKKEFLIENNVPRKPDSGLKKPSASVKPAKNARKAGKSR
jgi:hypothetical protein